MPHSRLASPSATIAALDRYGLRTRKSLGQHFLIDDNVVGRILELAAVAPGELVLGIGGMVAQGFFSDLRYRSRKNARRTRTAAIRAVMADNAANPGDPSGSGMGGPGYYFINEDSDLTFDKEGVVAMANAGRDTNGSPRRNPCRWATA